MKFDGNFNIPDGKSYYELNISFPSEQYSFNYPNSLEANRRVYLNMGNWSGNVDFPNGASQLKITGSNAFSSI